MVKIMLKNYGKNYAKNYGKNYAKNYGKNGNPYHQRRRQSSLAEPPHFCHLHT